MADYKNHLDYPNLVDVLHVQLGNLLDWASNTGGHERVEYARSALDLDREYGDLFGESYYDRVEDSKLTEWADIEN